MCGCLVTPLERRLSAFCLSGGDWFTSRDPLKIAEVIALAISRSRVCRLANKELHYAVHYVLLNVEVGSRLDAPIVLGASLSSSRVRRRGSFWRAASYHQRCCIG